MEKKKVKQGIVPYESDNFSIGFDNNQNSNYAHVVSEVVDNNTMYKIASDLIEKGYIIHCTPSLFDKFDISYFHGVERAKEGYGFYFSDMPYKPIEYGSNMIAVKKDIFNFLDISTTINLDWLTDKTKRDDLEMELAYWTEKIYDARNNREYDYCEEQIKMIQSKLNEYKKYDELFLMIDYAIKYGAKVYGNLDHYIPNWRKYLPQLAKLYISKGIDGYVHDGIYTIFNIDKLNQNMKHIDIDNYVLNEQINPEDVDLSSFKIKDKLNPKFWKEDKLDSRIRLKLLDIADDFVDFLQVDWVEPEDITITGSIANYNWSKYSDIDLHIIIDFRKVDKRIDFVSNYFKSKKDNWNNEHSNLNIFGLPVEVYVQDKNEPHSSSGVYSLEKNDWVKKPSKQENLTKSEQEKVSKQSSKWMNKIDNLMSRYYPDKTDSEKEKIINDINTNFDKIKNNRRNAFSKGKGEMNIDNIIFKVLRRNGYLDKLWDKKNEIYDNLNSINESFSKPLIIYHRIDWDGYTSAAIALEALPNAKIYGWNYGDPLPDISVYDKVFLLDLTISNKNDYTWMIENEHKLVWIDHHSNAISNIKNANIKGIRQDGIGACILTWQYFFPNKQLPLHVALCGTYDVFKKDGEYCSWEDAWAYQLFLNRNSQGMQSAELVAKAQSFINQPQQLIIDKIEQGKHLEEERGIEEDKLFNSASFVDRNGIRICKLIADGQPAMLIKRNIDNHSADLFVIRSVNPLKGDETKYKIALRVPEKSNVDASKIARQFGGNGHIKAAGCIMTLEEFENL